MASSYRPGLNFVRFYAAFSVLIFHIINDPRVWFGDAKIAPYLQLVFLNGEDAVELFFVLSGFIITNSILTEIEKTGHFSPKAFYLRRVLRILPLYSLTSIIGLALLPVVFPDSPGLPPRDLASLVAILLLMPNAAYALTWNHVLGHLWSIGVEEQFYGIYPILVRVQKKFFLILLTMIAAPWCLMAGALFFENDYWIVFGLRWRFDCIGIGGLAACAAHSNSPWLKVLFHPLLEILALAGVATILVWPGMRAIEFVIFRALIFAIYVANVSWNTRSWFCLESRLTAYLGQLSYPIYMLHPPVIFCMRHLLLGTRYYELAMVGGCITVTLLLAMISYRYFETPFLELKERLYTPALISS